MPSLEKIDDVGIHAVRACTVPEGEETVYVPPPKRIELAEQMAATQARELAAKLVRMALDWASDRVRVWPHSATRMCVFPALESPFPEYGTAEEAIARECEHYQEVRAQAGRAVYRSLGDVRMAILFAILELPTASLRAAIPDASASREQYARNVEQSKEPGLVRVRQLGIVQGIRHTIRALARQIPADA
jgi:hypothetical protein